MAGPLKQNKMKTSIQYIVIFLLLSAIALSSCRSGLPEDVAAMQDQLPEKVDFNFHIKPILSDRCFACHGPDANKRKAELRLDIAENAYAALASGAGHALVPGKPGQSAVYERILSDDPEYVMPPPESNLQLSAGEKALLVRWIQQGAVYSDHWAFIPPKPQELPAVKQTGWANNAIDRFILARLEKQQIEPSPKAEKEQLIRRLSFDLTGLPPSLEAIDQFLAATDPGAYETLVDQLLASPAYGERMAAHWMDVARYADSEGYLDDFWRRMWPWRDWVIEAFNKNLPYDQFVLWQIGGDQIPGASHEQILATGFNRNHKHNSEGGVIPEEFRIENVADRTNTLGKAFMGLTLGCARCHDHKYDPISQKNYYELFSFFNNTDERGDGILGNDAIDPGPTLPLSKEETRKVIDFIQHKIEEKEAVASQESMQARARFATWDATNVQETIVTKSLKSKQVAHYTFDDIVGNNFDNQNNSKQKGSFWETSVVPGIRGEALQMESGGGVLFPGDGITFERTEAFAFSLYLYTPKAFEEANVIFNANSRVQGYRGYDVVIDSNHVSFRINHAWPYQSLHVESEQELPLKEWVQLTFTYDGSSSAEGIKMYWNGQPVATRIRHNRLYRSIIPRNGTYIYIPYNGMGAGNRHYDADFAGGRIDEVQVFNQELSPIEVAALFDPLTAAGRWQAQQAARLAFYALNEDSGMAQARDSLHYWHQKHLATIDTITELMVMGDQENLRPTYILDRGEYDKPGKVVAPGVPESILAWDEQKYPRNRYGLGQWLIDRENPLTARVMVNRLWQLVFGKGIVRTSEDFGNQGELPTHPELLDWLAIEFMDSGWDMKHMLKLMVMSATYQQSSVIRPGLKEIDPNNTLLARSPRYRLDAEMVRDNALAVSGLLVQKQGGQGVFPYQPSGLWREVSNHPWGPFYHADKGEGLYRRSLYTIWKRNVPPPYMLIFDANDRNQCEVRRQNSSTPLQALVLLNDPQMVEACRALAERSIREFGIQDIAGALKMAFRRLTSRFPSEREMDILQRQFADERAYFLSQPEALQQYLEVGEARLDGQLDRPTVAAVAVVCNTVLNTTEAYYKN